MAKNRKFKLSKKQRVQAYSVGIPLIAGCLGLIGGIILTRLLMTPRSLPTNLVWAADKTVNVPQDLRTFLESKQNCNDYRGKGAPAGVGLWGVYQTTGGRFAKIAYGCSWSLDTYIMAIKQKDTWQLLPPSEYFAPFKDAIAADKGALPFCAVLEKYKIPKNIESFCVTSEGNAKPNQL